MPEYPYVNCPVCNHAYSFDDVLDIEDFNTPEGAWQLECTCGSVLLIKIEMVATMSVKLLRPTSASPDTCPVCGGSGGGPDAGTQCIVCHGRGTVTLKGKGDPDVGV